MFLTQLIQLVIEKAKEQAEALLNQAAKTLKRDAAEDSEEGVDDQPITKKIRSEEDGGSGNADVVMVDVDGS